MNYTPDKWVIVKLTYDNDVIYKVLGSWYGGFTSGDSWRLSSGVTYVEDKDKYYNIHNESGSVYECYKDNEGMSSYTSTVYERLKKELDKSKKGTMIIVNVTEIPNDY